MNALTYRVGAYPLGIPLMKFTLTYDGELPSTGNHSKKIETKWEIRKHFHPQLEELWQVHPALRQLQKHGSVMAKGRHVYVMMESHHEYEAGVPPALDYARPLADDQIDLCALISRGAREFQPLVRKSFALTCGLKILFLRRGPAGKVYQGGDLDNRIKTLLDALAIPPHREHVLNDPTITDPILCLVEDDSLITGLSVETERLLSRPNTPESEVRLIIEVDVRVSDSRLYNTMFLGD